MSQRLEGNAPNRIITDGDPEWWRQWKAKLKLRGKPVVCSVRYTFLRVVDVNEKDQEFDARVRIDCEINANDAFGELPRRKSLSGGAHTNYLVKDGDSAIEEFNPKIVLMNLKRTPFQKPSKWVRRDEETGILTFSMEVSGWFSVPVKFSSYPIDTHMLNVQVTTDWSEDFVTLQPAPKGTHQFTLFDQFEIKREYEPLPGVKASGMKNMSSKRYKYSQVDGAVMIRRKALSMFAVLVLRPFAVTTIGFSVFAIRPTNSAAENEVALANRITIVLVLLLASAVEPRRSYTTFTFTDFYVTCSFMVLLLICLETVLVLSDLFLDQGQKQNNDTIGFIVLAVIWGVTNVTFVVAAFVLNMVAEAKERLWRSQVGQDESNDLAIDIKTE